MKVLYFARDYTPHDFRFLNAITGNGDEVFYLRLETRNQYENRPIPEAVHVVDWEFGKAPFDMKKDTGEAVEALKRVWNELSPDVIHSGPLTDTSYIAAKAGIHPHIAMSWGFDLGREIETDSDCKERAKFALAHADWFLGDCYVELNKAAELGYRKERATIFPWGIDIARFSPGESKLRGELAKEDEFLVLSLRTMEPNYDVETALRGFLLAAKKSQKIRLILLGDGSLMPKLKGIASSDPNGGRVCFLGRQPNDLLVDYYRAADLYLSASIVDGSSVSLLEAMGCGTPVLMSAIPGNLEWVRDNENGMLFECRDTQTIADKILFAVENRDVIHAFAETARSDIEAKADWNKNKAKIKIAYSGAKNQ